MAILRSKLSGKLVRFEPSFGEKKKKKGGWKDHYGYRRRTVARTVVGMGSTRKALRALTGSVQ